MNKLGVWRLGKQEIPQYKIISHCGQSFPIYYHAVSNMKLDPWIYYQAASNMMIDTWIQGSCALLENLLHGSLEALKTGLKEDDQETCIMSEI